MPKRPRIKCNPETGDRNARIDVPRAIWLVAIELGREYEMRDEKAVKLLLRRFGDVLADPQRVALLGQALGPDVTRAIAAAQRDNFGALASSMQIDTSKLARDPKLKSGFVGVFPHGKGWRTEGRNLDGLGTRALGVFGTAEEASWIRFLYYSKHDLPYGYWEAGIDRLRKAGVPGSDADLIFELEETNRVSGQEHLNLQPGKPKSPSAFVPNSADYGPSGGETEADIAAELEALTNKNNAHLIKKNAS